MSHDRGMRRALLLNCGGNGVANVVVGDRERIVRKRRSSDSLERCFILTE